MQTSHPDTQLPTAPTTLEAERDTGTQTRKLPLFGLRRNILINPSFQIRALLLPTLISVGTVFALILAVHSVLRAGSEELGTEFGRVQTLWRIQELEWLLTSLALTGLFAALMLFIGLVETHRAAGAVFNMKRLLTRVADGDLQGKVYLRRRDHFQDVAQEFNRMVDALRSDTKRDLDQINQALEQIGHVRPSGPDSERLAAAWDQIVDLKHRKERALG